MNDMKIAFTTRGTQWDSRMDPRFGRTEFLLVYDPENDELLSFDNRTIENEARGAGPKTSRMLHELGSDTALGFFQKRGYVAQQRNTVTVGGEWLANTTMHKQLAPPETS